MINKYDAISIISFAIGVVASPGIAEIAVEAAATAPVIVATVIFLSSNSFNDFWWNSGALTLFDIPNKEINAITIRITTAIILLTLLLILIFI